MSKAWRRVVQIALAVVLVASASIIVVLGGHGGGTLFTFVHSSPLAWAITVVLAVVFLVLSAVVPARAFAVIAVFVAAAVLWLPAISLLARGFEWLIVLSAAPFVLVFATVLWRGFRKAQ